MKRLYLRTFMLLLAMTVSLFLKAQTIVTSLDENFNTTSVPPSDWDISATKFGSSGNWKSATGGVDASRCISINYSYSGYSGEVAVLKSPTFQLPVLGSTLYFDYKNTAEGDMKVLISTDGGITTTEIGSGYKNTNSWTSVNIDLSAYVNENNVKIIFRMTMPRGSINAVLSIDNVKVETTPRCAKPIDLYLSALSQTEFTVNWTLANLGSASSVYHIIVKDESGIEVLNEDSLLSSTNSTTVTNLQPNTTYSVVLQSDCCEELKGLSAWSDTFYFTTLCNKLALPIIQDFSSTSVPMIPECWVAGGDNLDKVVVSADKKNTDGTTNQSIKLVALTSADAYIASPQIDHEANDMEINFNIYGPEGAQFSVAFTNNIKDVSAFVPFFSGTIIDGNAWNEYVIQTTETSYAAQKDLFLVFYLPAGRSSTVYFDNIKITEKPTCIRPDSLIASNILPSSATLSWTGAQEASNYQIKIMNGDIEEIVGATTNQYTHTSLVENTNYTASVRQICTVGDTSAWSSSISFRTPCSPSSLLPMAEGFEGETFPPACWLQKQIQRGTGSGTDYKNTAWGATSTKKYAGKKCLYLQSSKAGTRTIMSLPYMNIPAANAYEVRFYMFRDDYSSYTSQVRVWTNSQMDTLGGTLLGEVSTFNMIEPTEEKEGWYQYSYTIPQSGDMFIMLEGVNKSGSIYVDSVEVRELPSCLPIKKIKRDSVNTTQAFFSWTVTEGAASKWIVTYKTSDMGAEVSDTVTQTNYTVSDLVPSTLYTCIFKVKALCSISDVSEEKNIETQFRTKCASFAFPFSEDFSDNFKNNTIHCWSFPVKYSLYPKELSGALYTSKQCAAVTPALDIDTWVGKRIKIDIKSYSAPSPIRFGIMSDPMDTNTFVLIDTIKDYTSTYSTKVLDVKSEHLGRHLAIMTANGAGSIYFDNLKITNTPVCEDISNYVFKNLDKTTADIIIADKINSAWEVQYSTAPFDESNAMSVSATDTSYTLVNLLPDTRYAVRVRCVCTTCPTENNKGNWTVVKEFKTLCEGFEITNANPFFEGFESGYTDNSPVAGCWTQESIEGNYNWIANSSQSSYNCAPYEGSFNAFLKESNEDYMMHPLNLKANTNYQFSIYARQNNTKGCVLNVSVDTESTGGHKGTLIIDNKQVMNGEYQRFTNYFIVPEDGAYYLKIGSDMDHWPDNISIDNIKVEVIECAPPTASTIIVAGIADDSVALSISNPAPQLFVKLATTSIDPQTTDGDVANDTVKNKLFCKSGLSANTTYYYYVKSLCGDGKESVWSEEGTFTTLCMPVGLPLTENFDEGAPGFACWSVLTEAKPTLNSSIKYAGTHSLKCENGILLVSPELMVESLVGNQLSAKVRVNKDFVRFAVGVLEDINSLDTYEQIYEIEVSGQKNKWVEVFAFFDTLALPDYSYLADAKNIAIYIPEDIVYIDDILIEEIPSCPKPISMSLSNIAESSVTVDWVAKNETKWRVKVLDEEVLVMDTVVTSHPVNIAGLVPTSLYTIDVQAICAEGDSSLWSTTSFTTTCAALYSLPFEEDFTYADGFNCWINDKHSTPPSSPFSKYWYRYVGAGDFFNTVAFNSWSFGNGEWSILQTPALDLKNVAAATLEFDAANPVGGELQVLISTDNGQTFTDTIVKGIRAGVNEFVAFEHDLTSYCGQEISIGFRGISNAATQGRIYFDNVRVYVPSMCKAPVSLEVLKVSTDSIQIAIDDTTNATAWEVALVPQGQIIENFTEFISVSNDTFSIKTVKPAMRYTVYVRTKCPAENSVWVSSQVITTPCDRLDLPYAQNFDHAITFADILCTEALQGGNATKATIEKNSVQSGTQALRLTAEKDSALYFVLPELNASVDTISMSFFYKNGDVSYKDATLQVGLLPLSLKTDDFILLKEYPKSAVYTKALAEFSHLGMGGTSYRIAFKTKALAASKYMIIDNINVDYREECVAPQGVKLIDATSSSLDVRIIDHASSAWQLAYGKAGVSFENLAQIDNITDDSVRISDLEHSTIYQVYVRAACGGDTTAWSDVSMIATECADITVDETNSYVENFEAYNPQDVPACWTVIENHMGDNNICPSVADINGKMLDIREGEIALALPKFTTPINRMYMSLDAKYFGGSQDGSNFFVSYTDNTANVENIVDIYTINATKAVETFNIDLTVFPADAQYIVIRTKDATDIAIDNVRLTLAPECYTPNSIKPINIMDNSADITYLSAPNSTNVELALYKNGTKLNSVWTSDNPITLSDLDESTQYTVVLRSACSDNGSLDTTEWSDTIFFSTYETPATMPYVGTFENIEDNLAWNIAGNGTNNWTISSKDIAAVKEGTNALYITNNDSANAFTVSQASSSWAYRTFSLQEGVYSLSYFYQLTGSSDDFMRVFLIPANIEPSSVSFQHWYTEKPTTKGLIDADNGTKLYNKAQWSELSKEIVINEAGFYNLAFYWTNNNTDGYQRPAAIDSINFYRIVECTSIVDANVIYSNTDSAAIAFSNFNENEPLSYQVILKTDNSEITQYDLDNALNISANNNILGVNNLNADTEYHTYVRTICSLEDSSEWTDAIIFRTTCLPDSVNKNNIFFEGFEDYADQEMVTNCWVQEQLVGNAGWKGRVNIEYWNLKPRSGNVSGYLIYSSSSDNSAKLMRNVHLTAGKEYKLSIWARQGGSEAAKAIFNVGLSYNGVYTEIEEKQLLGGAYQEVGGIFTPEVDGVYTLTMTGLVKSGALCIVLDDITISQICSAPNQDLISVRNITNTAATINFSTDADSMRFVISGNAFTLDTVVPNASAGSLNVIGLSPSNIYNVSATNFCGSNESSATTFSFATLCDLKNLPYLETFESYTVDAIPVCWDNTEGTVDDMYRWKVADDDGNKVMKFNSYSATSGTTNTLKSVTLDIDSDNYIFSVDYKNPKGGEMSIFLSMDGGLTLNDTIVNKCTAVSNWTNASKEISHYNGKLLTVVVKSISNNSTGDAYHYIDNVKVACHGGIRNIYDSICSNSPYEDHGFSIPASATQTPGAYTFERIKTAVDASTCDTTIVLNLNVNQSYEHVIYDVFCEGDTYNKGLFVNLKKADTYTVYATAKNGCDSTVTLVLTSSIAKTAMHRTICEGDTISFAGEDIYESGVYRDTLKSADLCDSIVTLTLSVTPKYHITNASICEGDIYTFEGKNYTESGRYEEVYKNAAGCDSILVLFLTVHGTTYTLDTTICEGQSIFFNGETYNSSGSYSKSFDGENNCDSTATLNLTVIPADTITINDYVCEGREYYGNGIAGLSISTDTIVYSRTQSTEGCDSVVKLYIKLSPTQEAYDTVVISSPNTYKFGGTDLSISGDYDHKFYNSLGCDSIVYLHLIVNEGVGVDNVENSTFIVAPNPVDGGGIVNLHLDFSVGENSNILLEIIDATGRVVFVESNPMVNSNTVSISAPAERGVYYIRVTSNVGNVSIGKLIVK